MKITRFEELECWQEARKLVRLVYQSTSKASFSKDFGLRDQMQRAAVSVMSNIAEGFGSKTNPEFIRFLDFSIRSCAEVQSHAYVALDLGYVDDLLFKKIFDKAGECSNLCKGLVRYLKEKAF